MHAHPPNMHDRPFVLMTGIDGIFSGYANSVSPAIMVGFGKKLRQRQIHGWEE